MILECLAIVGAYALIKSVRVTFNSDSERVKYAEHLVETYGLQDEYRARSTTQTSMLGGDMLKTIQNYNYNQWPIKRGIYG